MPMGCAMPRARRNGRYVFGLPSSGLPATFSPQAGRRRFAVKRCPSPLSLQVPSPCKSPLPDCARAYTHLILSRNPLPWGETGWLSLPVMRSPDGIVWDRWRSSRLSSPPQGGRIYAASSRLHFCVLSVASFRHAKVKPLIAYSWQRLPPEEQICICHSRPAGRGLVLGLNPRRGAKRAVRRSALTEPRRAPRPAWRIPRRCRW